MVPVGLAGEATTSPASGAVGVRRVEQLEGRLEPFGRAAGQLDHLAAQEVRMLRYAG